MEENKENVVETPKKKSKAPMILGLVVGLAIIAAALVVLLTNKPTEPEKDKEEPPVEDKIEETTLSEEEATKLIGYVPYSTPYSKEKDYSAFDSKKVSVNEMDANWLVYNAMIEVTNKGTCTTEQFNLNGLCDFTLTKADVEKKVKELYGDANIEYPNVVGNNYLWHCTLDKDVYACSNSGGGYALSDVGKYFDLEGSRVFTKYQKAEKDSKTLYLYVKFGKLEMVYDEQNAAELKASDITFRVRKYGTGNDVIDEAILNGQDYYEANSDKKIYDKVYEKFGEKMTTYKLTYNITSGGLYNLVSVEPVQ